MHVGKFLKSNTQATIESIDQTIHHLMQVRNSLQRELEDQNAKVAPDYPPSAAHEDIRPYLGTGDQARQPD